MRNLLYIIFLAAALLIYQDAGAQQRRTRRKNDAAETEVVHRIRISVSLSDLQDSITRVENHHDKLFFSQLDSACLGLRYDICESIDRITGLGKGRPRSYLGDLVVSLAKEHLGKPYKWAANGPDCFDCSGFTRFIYRQIGVELPRHSGDQYKSGRKIDVLSDLQEGDLVFFGTKRSWRTVGHVGIVVYVNRESGYFNFIHASSAGGVRISRNNEAYFLQRYIGGARYINDGSL